MQTQTFHVDPKTAAMHTLSHLEPTTRSYLLHLAKMAQANDRNPNVTEVACRRFREIAARHVERTLDLAGVVALPHVAAWKVVAR